MLASTRCKRPTAAICDRLDEVGTLATLGVGNFLLAPANIEALRLGISTLRDWPTALAS